MAQRFLRNVAQKRTYVTQAAKTAEKSAGSSLEVNAPQNGVKLAAQDNGSSLARVVVAVKAGSRYEAYNQRGASAYIRTAAELTQDHAYSITVTKDILQCGGNLTCSATRDNILYTLEGPRDTTPNALHYLRGMITELQFRPWELSACQARMEYEMLRLTEQPEHILMDKLHSLAYRNHGLGNSLYKPDHNEPDLTKMLKDYVDSNFTTDRISVSALNIPSKFLTQVCSEFDVGRKSDFIQQPKPTFYSGELRDNTFETLAYTAISGEGAAVTGSDVYAYAVLEQILGAPESVKWSSNNTSNLLNKSVGSKTELPYSVRCFNANYSDSGLFGVNIVTIPENSDVVVRSVVETLRNVRSTGLSEQLEGAKQRVKAQLSFAAERWTEVNENQALELNCTGKITSLSESLKQVDNVKQSDVQDAAKKVVSKMCMASRGEINNVPYLDAL